MDQTFPESAGRRAEAEIEVRPLKEPEELGPSEAAERFRNLGAASKR